MEYKLDKKKIYIYKLARQTIQLSLNQSKHKVYKNGHCFL